MFSEETDKTHATCFQEVELAGDLISQAKNSLDAVISAHHMSWV